MLAQVFVFTFHAAVPVELGWNAFAQNVCEYTWPHLPINRAAKGFKLPIGQNTISIDVHFVKYFFDGWFEENTHFLTTARVFAAQLC